MATDCSVRLYRKENLRPSVDDETSSRLVLLDARRYGLMMMMKDDVNRSVEELENKSTVTPIDVNSRLMMRSLNFWRNKMNRKTNDLAVGELRPPVDKAVFSSLG